MAGMTAIERRETPAGVRWRVRWRTESTVGPDGKSRTGRQVTRSFASEREAKKFRDGLVVQRASTGLTDPRRGRQTVGDLRDRWMESHAPSLSPSSLARVESAWRAYITTKWGEVAVASITTDALQSWVWALAAGTAPTSFREGKRGTKGRTPTPLSPESVIKIMVELGQFLAWCVTQRLIPTSPMAGVERPRIVSQPMDVLTHQEFADLCDGLPAMERTVLAVMAHAGLRWGEVAALRVRDVTATRLRIVESTTQGESGRLVTTAPKWGSVREVPLPPSVMAMVQAQTEGKAGDELVFTTRTGTALRNGNFRRSIGWAERVAGVGHPGLRIHDLRHTAVSWILAQGGSVVVAQRIAGHAKASTTLGRYAHLVGDELDEAARRMEEASAASGGIAGPTRAERRAAEVAEARHQWVRAEIARMDRDGEISLWDGDEPDVVCPLSDDDVVAWNEARLAEAKSRRKRT